eukprot:GHVH01009080.1.p1 GENE.GHVH01009080.1~~GHVH01009080.1.p1  ORF type:complete len:1936 (-),score=260.13 GHVH01009080.1:1324-7131(-)
MNKFNAHQVALLRKTLYLKRWKIILSICEVAVPAVLLSILWLSTIYFQQIDNIASYDFTDPKWDDCPIGFYGAYLDRILPYDFMTSSAAYGMAGLSTYIRQPFLERDPFIENYPLGIDEYICTDEMLSKSGLAGRVNSDTSSLSDYIYYIDSGRQPSNAKITYSTSNDEVPAPEKPEFVVWLENLCKAFRPGVSTIPGYTCPSSGCLSDDQFLFDSFFSYDCQFTDTSTANELTPEDCLEWIATSENQLDGPGLSGDNGTVDMVYRDESTINTANDFDSEIVHLHILESAGDSIHVTVMPNSTNAFGAQMTSSLLVSAVEYFGMSLLYEAGSIQGFYGSKNDKGRLMDIEPLVALYAMKDGSGINPSIDFDPDITDYWSFIVSSLWWSKSAYSTVESNRASVFKTGIPSLPWFYKGGVPIDNDQDSFYDAYKVVDIEDRVEFAKLGQSLFIPACHLKNASVNLPASQVAERAKLGGYYSAYREVLREIVTNSSSQFNITSQTRNPLTSSDIDRFIDFMDTAILESVDGTSEAGRSNPVPCRGEHLELISKELTLLWNDHYSLNNLDDPDCNCKNSFCLGSEGIPCDYWFKSIYTVSTATLSALVSEEVFSPLEELTHFSTKEVAFPQPAGAISAFGWQMNSQNVAYEIVQFAFMIPAIFFIRLIMSDKEQGVIPYLNVIGITQTEYWMNYYSLGVAYFAIFSVFCSLILEFILARPNFLILWFGFFSQGTYLLSFCVLLSSVTRTGNTTVLLLVCVMMICNSLFMWCITAFVDSMVWLKYLSCVLPGFNISFIFRHLMLAETFTVCDEIEEGGLSKININPAFITGDCVPEGASIDFLRRTVDGISAGWMVFMGFAYTIVLAFVAHYIINVFPTDDTPAKKWNFMFSLDYWKAKRGQRRTKGESSTDSDDDEETKMALNESKVNKWFDVEPPGKTILEVNCVSKRFRNARKVVNERGKYFYAVNSVSLRVKKGEIFCLLGHNGAGKTTLMNMMIGKASPTKGSISIDGWNISEDPSMAKKSIGFCPQFDILFPYMTVRQHLKFVAIVKQCEDIEAEIAYASKVLDLDSKLDFFVGNLSGGQRRRCSVGMSVIGHPSLVILDEPSTGIDPATRRSLWKCIKRISQDCAVILTTHFMDEAEYLSDRVGIMASGILMACGRRHHLKLACNSGYTITMAKSAKMTSACDASLHEFVEELIPDAVLRSDIANEIVYNVPFASIRQLTKVVETLEEDAEDRGVVDFSVSVASIEDVFLKVGAHGESKVGDIKALKNDIFSQYSGNRCKPGFAGSLTNNFKPLLVKKFLTATRKKFLLLVALIGPTLNFILFGSMITTQFSQENVPLIEINGDTYRSWNAFDLTTPTVYVIGDEKIAECLAELDYNGYVVKSPDRSSIHKLMLDSQIDFLQSGVAAPLFALDIGVEDVDSGVSDITLYHNSQVYTWSLPIAYVELTRCYIHSRGASNYEFKVSYQPQKVITDNGSSIFDLLAKGALNMIFTFSLIYASCIWIVQLIVERTTHSKYLQMIAGANPWYYWISNFLADFVVFVPSLVILCLTAWGFGAPIFATLDSTWSFIVACLFYALTDIPRSYCFSRIFNSTVGGIGLNFAYGGIVSIVGSILPMLINEIAGVKAAVEILNCFPTFILQIHATQISNITGSCPFNKSTEREMFDLFCNNVWDPSVGYITTTDRGFGYFLLRYAGNLLLWVGILMFIDFRDLHPQKFSHLKKERAIMNPDNLPEEGASVIAERMRIREKYGDVERDDYGQPLAHDYPNEVFEEYCKYRDEENVESKLHHGEDDVELLVLRGLRKAYKGRRGCCCGLCKCCCHGDSCKGSPCKVAVDDLSFTVNRGECFGFLGMNGAGKTTTVAMLIGELARTSGTAHFNGTSVSANRTEFYKNIGYCPQFDGLIPSLTAREIIRFYSLLSGMDNSVVMCLLTC